MCNEDELWELASYGRISRNRYRIITQLGKRPYFPSELAKELKINFSTVSECLAKLKERRIVLCLSPSSTKGRLYGLTETGKKINSMLTEIDHNTDS
ncbi:MAG: ArsR family transcriptional regulator [Candidatus Thorarchaeota archaeon]